MSDMGELNEQERGEPYHSASIVIQLCWHAFQASLLPLSCIRLFGLSGALESKAAHQRIVLKVLG